MASFNKTLFLPLLVAISALLAAAAPFSVEAQLPPILPRRLIINGSLSCITNGVNIPVPLSFSFVYLKCGNTIVVETILDGAFGVFLFLLDDVENVILVLLSVLPGASTNCRLIVDTREGGGCDNVTLNNGYRVSILTPGAVEGTFVIEPETIINIDRKSFQFTRSLP